MSNALTRDVPVEELRRMAEEKRDRKPEDALNWLEAERDLEAAKRKEAFDTEDKVAANRHDERCVKMTAVCLELAQARVRLAAMTEVLQGRLMVAVGEVKRPPWKPTHQHYKGGKYRQTGTAQDSTPEELVDMVIYDDREGHTYVLTKARWESTTTSGKPRYRPLFLHEAE